MLVYGPKDAEVTVFTYKEGLLSAIAHDLRIAARRFEIKVAEDRSRVEATVHADSLEVVCAMRDGIDTPRALSDKDKRKIASNIRKDVLRASRYPEIVFRSATIRPVDDGYDLEGDLTLHGRNKSLVVHVREGDSAYRAELTLHQPDFGITPYRAMMGTLKVQADIRLQVVIPKVT